MSNPTLLGIPGALRQESCNRRLLREALRLFGAAGYTEADLRLPLYDGDLEEAKGIPAPVATLHSQIAAADAVLISTPEYNKNLSGVLKNALDWVSRVKGPSPWKDKPVVVMSAAEGRAGGERATNSLVLCLMPFRPRLIYGPEMMLAHCRSGFDDDGRLVDDRAEALLAQLMEKLRGELRL